MTVLLSIRTYLTVASLPQSIRAALTLMRGVGWPNSAR
jgi:hypothetical protein